MAEEILELEVNSNIKGVIQDVDTLTDAVENTNTSYKRLNRTVGKNNKLQQDNDKLIMRGIENFRVFGFSIRSVRRNLKLLGPISKKLFGTIKSGIAATGVGLLVIAFGTLMGALMGTKKGAALLKAGIEGLKVIFAPFLYVIEKVADGLTWLFGIESTPAVSAAEKLEKAYERLGQEMDKIALKELQGQKAKFDNKEIIDDTTKSEEERLAASKENAEIDKKNLEDKIAAQVKLTKTASDNDIKLRGWHKWERKRAVERNDWHKVANDNESSFSKSRDKSTVATKALAKAEQDLQKLRNQQFVMDKAAEKELIAIKEYNIKQTEKDTEKAQKKEEAQREKNRNTYLANEKKKAADELSIAQQLEKVKQELYYRTLETVKAVEIAKLVAQHKATRQAIKDSTASKKVKDAALLELDKKYTSDLNIIKKRHQDIADEETRVAEEKLSDFKEANRIEALEDETEQALALLQIQKDKEDEALKSFENYAELKLELDEKYLGIEADINKKASDKQIELDKVTADAKAKIRDANIGNIDAGIALVKSLAGESKGVMAASIIAENASAIAKILINTAVANAKAVASSPMTGGLPWVAINSVSAGIGIAGSIAAAAKGLSALGEGGDTGGGNPDTPSAAPPAPEMMSGAFSLEGGQAVEPARAYVVSDDITANQNKLAIIRRRATI